ncbi:MAG: NAD(P)-binding domain-containing protein, partial [Solimonas sp.]
MKTLATSLLPTLQLIKRTRIMAKIAFLGLGAMGSRMAANLIKAGHHLAVWNRDTARGEPLAAQGADMVGTPKVAAVRADVVIAMVRDDEASRAVWLDADTGALAGMSRHAVAIDCSTLTVGWVQA